MKRINNVISKEPKRAKEEENPELREERIAANIPDTIDSKRIYDETIAAEVEGDDEFQSYFTNLLEEPKILLTTSANAKNRPMNLRT